LYNVIRNHGIRYFRLFLILKLKIVDLIFTVFYQDQHGCYYAAVEEFMVLLLHFTAAVDESNVKYSTAVTAESTILLLFSIVVAVESTVLIPYNTAVADESKVLVF
jgi:hypothetical protein